MAGTLLSVVPARQFNFSGVAINQTLSVVLKRKIDVSRWMTAALLVRVYNVSSMAGSIDISLQAESTAPEDPGLLFLQPTELAKVTLASGSSSDPYPYVLMSGTSLPLGSTVRVVAAARATLGGSNTFVAGFGVELCLKSAR